MSDFADFELFDDIDAGVILQRDARGVWTNVNHLVAHHSPTGYEWGYAGSGPADLALNIVEIALYRMGWQGARTPCWKGDCFRLAFELHQQFKFAFIATAPRAGTTIPFERIDAWVREHIPAISTGDNP